MLSVTNTLQRPPTASPAIPPTQTTASVLVFRCLYTHRVHQKQKRWQDGSLRFHTFNKRIMVYDDAKNFVGGHHLQHASADGVQEGEELILEGSNVLVQIEEQLDILQTNITELTAKRPPKPIGGVSENGTVERVQPQKCRTGISTRTPPRPLGRAIIPQKSPFELRQETLAHSQDKDRRPSKRPRNDNEHVPLSRLLQEQQQGRFINQHVGGISPNSGPRSSGQSVPTTIQEKDVVHVVMSDDESPAAPRKKAIEPSHLRNKYTPSQSTPTGLKHGQSRKDNYGSNTVGESIQMTTDLKRNPGKPLVNLDSAGNATRAHQISCNESRSGKSHSTSKASPHGRHSLAAQRPIASPPISTENHLPQTSTDIEIHVPRSPPQNPPRKTASAIARPTSPAEVESRTPLRIVRNKPRRMLMCQESMLGAGHAVNEPLSISITDEYKPAQQKDACGHETNENATKAGSATISKATPVHESPIVTSNRDMEGEKSESSIHVQDRPPNVAAQPADQLRKMMLAGQHEAATRKTPPFPPHVRLDFRLQAGSAQEQAPVSGGQTLYTEPNSHAPQAADPAEATLSNSPNPALQHQLQRPHSSKVAQGDTVRKLDLTEAAAHPRPLSTLVRAALPKPRVQPVSADSESALARIKKSAYTQSNQPVPNTGARESRTDVLVRQDHSTTGKMQQSVDPSFTAEAEEIGPWTREAFDLFGKVPAAKVEAVERRGLVVGEEIRWLNEYETLR